MKRKVLASLLVMAVVVGLVGASTLAYFRDTETSANNEFTAGTLDLEVNDQNPWASAIWTSPTNVAPGAPAEVAILTLTNSGSIGVKLVGVRGIDLTEVDNGYNEAEGPGSANDIANHIFLSTIGYTESLGDADVWIESSGHFDENGIWVSSGMLRWYEGVYGVAGTPLKLSAFVDSYAMVFWIGAWESGTDYLPPSEAFDQKVKLGFLFDPEAENEYQSDKATFNIRVEAFQSYDQVTLLGEGSGGYAE